MPACALATREIDWRIGFAKNAGRGIVRRFCFMRSRFSAGTEIASLRDQIGVDLQVNLYDLVAVPRELNAVMTLKVTV
jgi:hypothetical protein